MESFKILINDVELKDLIESIDERNKELLKERHGWDHTIFVVDTVEYVLRSLDYDDHMIELGKISALLHDIGILTGKTDHAMKSSEMSDYFLDKTHLTGFDKKRVKEAIMDHTDGEILDTSFGAALVIVDRLDLTCDRVLPPGKKDEWYRNLLEISNREIRVEDNKIIINYVTTEKFSKDIFNKTWKKIKEVIVNMCAQLECEFVLLLNGQ